MLKWRGSRLCLLLLAAGIFVGLNSAQAAAPKILSAKYLDVSNTLEITLDQPVWNNTVNVLRGGLTLDGDNGGKNPNLTLTGGDISGDPLSSVVGILLNYEDQQQIETMVDNRSLKLSAERDVFRNEAMEGNEQVSGIAVEYVADDNPPVVTAASYDAGANILSIDFNVPVNGRQVEIIRIAIEDGNGKSVKFASINENVITAQVASTMEIALSPKHQQLVENLDTSTLSLVLQPFAFIDGNRNGVVPTDADNPMAISYVADNNPTELISAEYHAGDNNLTLQFNESIVTSFWGTDAVNAKGIAIHDMTNNETARLSGVASVSVRSKVNLQINVLPADQRLIENLTSKDNLVISIDALAILDEFGNGIHSITTEDAIPVSYVPEGDNDGPTIDEASYDAETNILSLTFGNISARTRGIDTTAIDLSGIVLDDDNGGSNPDVTLSGGSITGIKAGTPAFIRIIQVKVNQDDEIEIESLANKDNISIGVDARSFFYESYTKTRNGNNKLDLGEVMVHYTSDEEAPQVSSAKYDFVEKQIKLKLTKLAKIESFDPRAVSFGGVTLTGGTVQEEVASSTITIDVSSQDQAAIDALPVATKAAPAVTISAGALVNLDGTANAALDYNDGDLNEDGNVVVVGYGRGFWDKSYQLFPTLDELVPASLRAVGEHCYIYVADDQWNVNVDQADVDTLLTAFEKSTPADPNKGIYQICTSTFGQPTDTDGDSRIIILLANLRDEYEVASGDASADIPKAGDFDTRHELSVDENPHSNQADMVFIDAYPIVEAGYAEQALATYFTNMILHGVDPDEEAWLSEALASMAMDLCGYGYTNFRYPAEKPVIPADAPLNTWTGWTGGHPGTDLNERNRGYLVMRYIYDQFGGVAPLSALAADEENGLASLNAVLAANGGTDTWNLLTDVALAALADKTDDPTYGNKYGYVSTDLRSATVVEIPFKTDEFQDDLQTWSLNYHLIKAKNNPGKVKFNGQDDAQFKIRVVTLDPLSITSVEPGAGNEVEFDLPQTDQSIYLAITRNGEGPVGPASYVVSKDLAAPEFLSFKAFQNPSVTRVIDFHFVSSERLYQDVPPVEGPVITATSEEGKNVFTGELVYSSDENGVYNYKASLELANDGNYTFVASGQDAGGTNFADITVSATIKKALPSQTTDLVSTLVPGRLIIPANALRNSTTIMAISDINEKAIDFGSADLQLQRQATLQMSFEGYSENSRVFRLENGEWRFVGGEISKDGKTISVLVDRLGKYSVREADAEQLAELESTPDSYRLSQNYPNPFNPTTTINYDLPQEGQVTIKVFDILGQEVATLVDGHFAPGYYKVTFDAERLATGVYFYQIKAGEFKQLKKMMVVK